MTIIIPSVNTISDSFGQWIAKTNQVIAAINSYAVTVNSNTAIGNAYISGTYFSDSIYANTAITVGPSSSNVVVNASFITVRSSASQNALISSTGMVIGGGTSYTQTLMRVGNTFANSTTLGADNLIFNKTATIGNTVLKNTGIYADLVNTQILWVLSNGTFGNPEANVQITSSGIEVISQPTGTYTVNTNIYSQYISTTDLYVANSIHSKNIYGTLVGSVTPGVGYDHSTLGNTEFSGLYNYFDNGITSNGSVELFGSDGLGGSYHFSTSYWPKSFSNYPSTIRNSNAVFIYQDGIGAAHFTRNFIDGNMITAGTSAEQLYMNNGTLNFYSFINGTPGVPNLFGTVLTPFSVNQSAASITSNTIGFGNSTNKTLATVYGGLIVSDTAPNSFGQNGYASIWTANNSAGAIGFSNDRDPDSGITSYAIAMDVGQIQFTFSTSASPYNVGSTAGYIDYQGNLKTNGSLGVGTTPSGTAGDVKCTTVNASSYINAGGNITSYYSSDRRLKTNITNIDHALDKISYLNGVEFDWSDEYIEKQGGEDGYFTRKHDIGVIAQEVEDILPEIVATREDGYKAVKYEKLVALLIEAVKELKQEVEDLKKR